MYCENLFKDYSLYILSILIANLHSLLNSPWYIQEDYAVALFPSLVSVLNGADLSSVTPHNPNVITAFNADMSPSLLGEDTAATTDKRVVVLGIKSPIYKYDQPCGPTGTRTMRATLEQFKTDDSIAGIVLDIDSGGGQGAGTSEFYDYISSYPKPIVSYTDGLICSAAYYFASASNHIIANKRADKIGSIGAMAVSVDMSGVVEKQGGKVHIMYASKSKKKNKSARALTEDNDTSVHITEVLDPLVEDFHNDMLTSRPNLNTEVLEGDVYTPQDALKHNLIDSIGTFADAVNKVFELSERNNSNLNKPQMSQKERPLLQAALGLESALQELDGHSSLSTEHFDQLEQTLSERNDSLSEKETQLNTANASLSELQNQNTELQTALDALLESNSVEVLETATPQEKLDALQGYITELGSRDAANPSAVVPSATERKTSFVDANASHNRLADKLKTSKN